MSKASVPKSEPKGKPKDTPTPQVPPQWMPLEHAERTAWVVDYTIAQDHDLLRVVVTAKKTSRLLQLLLRGLAIDYEYSGSELDTRDLDLLGEVAGGLQMFCDQAETLAAKQAAPVTEGAKP